MGLLSPTDWQAKWIGMGKNMIGEKANAIYPIITARALRKECKLSKKIKSAYLYVSAAGLYEFYINGDKIGDAVLTPALSQTEQRMYYNSYDVTKHLNIGQNTLAAYLGAGRWSALRPLQETTGEWLLNKYQKSDTLPGYIPRFPRLLAQINITYSDGSIEKVATDDTWKITSQGPITRNNEFDGESYDARKELMGWNKIGFNDSEWLNAELVPTPTQSLSAENKEPIKVIETLKPKSIKKLRDGVYIVDMGQNMVGWCKLSVKGKKGQTIQLVFSELLKPEGSLYLANMRTAEVTDKYTLKGDPNGEVWQPRFTYHGFRYVEISGFPGTPDLNTLEGQVVHDAVEKTGSFSCSNPTLTQLHNNAYWGIRGNYRSMPTDCPQRDERFGWLGDRSMEAKGESFIFKNTALYSKWMQDIKDAQLSNGSIPDVAPTHTGMIKMYSDGIVWPSCFVILPYVFYQQTGDIQIIEKNYEAMKKFIQLNLNQLKNGIASKNTYGDWCMPPEKPELIFSEDSKRKTSGILMSSCYLYYDLKLMNIFAQLLQKKQEGRLYDSIAQQLNKDFHRLMYNTTTFKYDNNSITSSLLPLGMGLTPEENIENVFKNTIQKLEIELNNHIATGLIGGQWQMKTLSKLGRPDLAYTLASNKDYPSWGYQIEQGATTIWELWNGDKARPDMNSGNHVMLLGDVIIWLYENVGGIASDIDFPGFKKIIMRPDLDEKITFAKTSHVSLYGLIKSEWKTEKGKFYWEIEIPPNTTAKVFVPAESEKQVIVNNGNFEGAVFEKHENGRAIYELGSGKYSIVSHAYQLPKIKKFVYSPYISPSDTNSNQSEISISIQSANPNSKIYYTLDGSIPTEKSTLYSKPFILKKSATVKAIEQMQGYPNSLISTRNIELYNSEVNDWRYSYYEGNWNKLPNFKSIKPVKNGIIAELSLSKIKQNKEDYWAAVLNSNLMIEKDGEYTFYITSDDGSKLLIDGKEIINIDGVHGMETGIGKIALLKGLHKIEIEYFEGNYGEGLNLEWQEKDSERRKIPISKMFYD
jgi:alpha-L-rhamnosidase